MLFRALEPLLGIEEMARARNIQLDTARDLLRLTSGPGCLAEAFGITRARDNGCDLTSPRSGLWIGDDGFRAREIQITPRIGISKAPTSLCATSSPRNAFVSDEDHSPAAKAPQSI